MTEPALTPAQLRQARELLRWTRRRFAVRTGGTNTAIARFEDEGLVSRPFSPQKAREILETAGVEFIESGVGVRLRKGGGPGKKRPD